MKIYHFTHTYLSTVQVGIQSQHSLVDLLMLFGQNEEMRDWFHNHKTIVSLDGGVTDDMDKLLDIFKNVNYNWTYFKEESLGNQVTSISTMLPERIYETAMLLRQGKIYLDEFDFKTINTQRHEWSQADIVEFYKSIPTPGFSQSEIWLIEVISKSRLAK